MKIYKLFTALLILVFLSSCGEDEPSLNLEIPDEYTSADFDTNVTTEATVLAELSAMTAAVNAAEAGAQGETIPAIPYPSNLSFITEPNYRTLVEGWLVELVAAANSTTGFQNPGTGTPAAEEEGGLLGTRLLDENGLELEQNVQKGSFGAALYNHALTVIDGDLSNSSAVDKLVLIHGTNPAFDPSATTAAATYSRRRSNQTTQTGFFYDIRNALIIAKAAIEGGDLFNTQRDQALEDYLLAWEKSNYATVIYYCNATKVQLQAAGDDPEALGNAMHAYAEGVGFAHGFRGVSRKLITDAQIDGILELLLAPAGQTPESYRFLNDATLLANLDQIISDIQSIYGFTDAEINTFYENDPT
ncbi:MAG: hypothetical protein R8G66_33125 [Cytophagales bacterium]|nr:hypothetical protein [Cytophagales bacterium]